MSDRNNRPGMFSALIRLLLPAHFRAKHENELTAVFNELFAAARARGMLAAFSLWIREAASLFSLAWRLRRNRQRTVLRPTTRGGMSFLDVKLGVRMLRKQPALTLVAVFALAIAIPVGLVPKHFTNAIEAPLPVEDGDRIRAIRYRDLATRSPRPISLRQFTEWRESLQTFDELAVTTLRAEFNVISEDGRAAPVAGAVVTASAFDVLRVRPILGRTLIRSDEEPGGPNVVVIGHDLWQSRLAGKPEIVGQSIRIGGVPHAVVGVMPEGFEFPFRDHLWTPLRADPLRGEEAGIGAYQVFSRLAPGVTNEEALAEIATLSARDPEVRPASIDPDLLRIQVVTFAEGFFGLPSGGFGAAPEYLLVQILTLILLAVACANVGMLMFAKTAARTSELAVRTALGASRARVVLQLFTEALVFAVLAAGTGLLIASRVAVGFDWMTQMLPYWAELRVRSDTVVWALGLAVLSAAFVSLVPALKVTGKSVQQNLQRAAAGRTGIRFGGVSSALIVIDVALAVATLGFAAGFSDSLTKQPDTSGIERGEFLHAAVHIPRINPGGGGTTDSAHSLRMAEATDAILRRLESEPSVRAATVATRLPGMDHQGDRYDIEGVSSADIQENFRAIKARVDIGYFAALNQPILTGRGFTSADLAPGTEPVIVNTNFVDVALGGRNPLGRRIRRSAMNREEPGPWMEIVGVVGSLGMNLALPGRDAGVYHALEPGALSTVVFAVHIGDDPAAFAPRLREIARDADPTAIVSDAVALDEVRSFQTFTLVWVKHGALGLIGILLALSASGIFALMSFTVVQRTREIGVRSALGAGTGDVAMAVAKRSLMQLGVGIAVGTPIAWRVLFELQRGLDRVPDHSPVLLALGGGIGVMVLVGSIACIGPTRRALRIAPTEALRSDV